LHRSAAIGYETGMNNAKPWWKEPTRKQWAAFAAAWVGWVLDAFDFVIYIVVAQHMIREFGITPMALGGSITLTLLVRLAGGFFAGWMADRWGRKLPLMLSLIWFAIFDALIFFAPTFTWVIVFRTLFGFGMGAEWTAGTSLAMESMPARSRKFASGMLQAGWPVGFLLAVATAYFVVPAWGWRAMFLIAAVPALMVIPIRMFVPDELSHVTKHEESKGAVKDLLSPGIPKMLILGSAVMALGFIVYYGLVTHFNAVHFEVAACMPDDKACLAATQSAAWIDTIWFNAGMLVGVVAAGWVANRFGVVAALVTPALLMVPALPLYVGMVPSLWIVGAFLGGALGVGYSGVTPVLTTSLFPAHVRARAIGIVYHVGALLAAFIPTFIPWLAKQTGMTLGMTMMMVVGGGLIAMSAAVLVLRNMISVPVEAQTPAPSPFDVDTKPVETPALRGEPATSQRTPPPGGGYPPTGNAVEHERPAERRALLS
jgi:SHS family lactate transporter-like MFS transporter